MSKNIMTKNNELVYDVIHNYYGYPLVKISKDFKDREEGLCGALLSKIFKNEVSVGEKNVDSVYLALFPQVNKDIDDYDWEAVMTYPRETYIGLYEKLKKDYNK